MALINSPSIVTSGLTFYYDMYNPNSYVGPPLTNILPNGINAGYPTTPSGWGTYNVNQYNGGNYFSIGTISSVVSNVVTTATNHPLRTYDVVTPQTTGGGVTAGTNYLVKKLSDTTFSLFSYDSTQDSYTIFSTHSSLDANTPVSINSTSFPTMWWGPVHLPNSGIMKQIVRNGFQWEGRVHDCLRIHWYRPDGVKDGMAYGNEPTVTAGQTYTISFYARAYTPNCVGSTVNIARWTNGEYTSQNFVLSSTWQKISYTFTTTQSGATYFYWFDINTPARSSWDVSEIMFYQGSGPSQYVASSSTRTSAQAVLDLTKNNTISVTGSPTYNNSNITFPNINTAWLEPTTPSNFRMGVQNFTLSAWLKQLDNGTNVILEARGDTPSLAGYLWVTNYPGAGQISLFLNYGGSQYTYTSSISTLGTGTVQNLVAVVDRANTQILFYVNGVLWNTLTGIHTQGISPTSGDMYRMGYDRGGSTQNFELYSYMHHNVALSAAEVYQNFNASRSRYGI